MKRLHRRFLNIIIFLLLANASLALNTVVNTPPQNDQLYELKSETKKEQIILHLKADGSWDYMIFSEDGSCIRMGLLEKGKNKISLKDLCKGSYFVYLSNGKQRFMEKVEQ